MNKRLRNKLAERYLTTLRKYLAEGQESVLEEAYELGRLAMAEGLGVLDMAKVHEDALERMLRPLLVMSGQEHILKAKETFLLETLSPFEAAHRGFRELNVKLQERNRDLEKEIAERKRAEKALRQSEKHYHQLYLEAQAMQEHLRDLSNKILRTQEEERKRISRELHDDIGQSLTALGITLATLAHMGDGKTNAGSQKFAESRLLLEQTMETVHRFARDLRPAMLDELGLLPALRSYLRKFADRTGLRICFRANPIAEQLKETQKIVVYRIVQESLTNVSKHARASQVDVQIRGFKDGICMEVADDGRSFRTNPVNSSVKDEGRLGLLGMQERARLVNGQLTIKAQPGKGTTVRVMIPFDPAVAPAPVLRGPDDPSHTAQFDRATAQPQIQTCQP